MHPMAVRAILATQISPEGRSKLRDYESRIFKAQPGRYLTGFEIVNCMKVKPKNPSDQEISRMDSLWFEYQKTQQRGGWDLEEQHPEVVELTRMEEIWAWEDYAVQHYLSWMSDRFVAQAIGTPTSIGRPRADLD